MTHRLVALLALVCWWVSGSQAHAAGSLVGALLSEAQRTDFFTFFQLEQVSQQGNTVAFKPSGRSFHDLVTVHVGVDGNKRITSMELGLARSFIDSSKNGPFARDIASNFLRATLTSNDLQKNRALVGWISNLQGYRVLEGSPHQPPTEPPPPTYAVYLGKQQQAEEALSGGALSLRNAQEGGVDWMWMRVTGR